MSRSFTFVITNADPHDEARVPFTDPDFRDPIYAAVYDDTVIGQLFTWLVPTGTMRTDLPEQYFGEPEPEQMFQLSRMDGLPMQRYQMYGTAEDFARDYFEAYGAGEYTDVYAFSEVSDLRSLHINTVTKYSGPRDGDVDSYETCRVYERVTL